MFLSRVRGVKRWLYSERKNVLRPGPLSLFHRVELGNVVYIAVGSRDVLKKGLRLFYAIVSTVTPMECTSIRCVAGK